MCGILALMMGMVAFSMLIAATGAATQAPFGATGKTEATQSSGPSQ